MALTNESEKSANIEVVGKQEDSNTEPVLSKEVNDSTNAESQEAISPPLRIKLIPLSKMTEPVESVQNTDFNQETSNSTNNLGGNIDQPNENQTNNTGLNDGNNFGADSSQPGGMLLTIKEEMADEDVLNGLNALESCFENSPEDFLNSLMDDSSNSNNKIQIKEESQLEDGEIPSKSDEMETIEEITKEEKLEMIYAEKLKTKEVEAKERLKKFAKTLETTFPVYKEFLDKVEKEHGVQFCKLEESKHAPWNVRHTNRWKLKCNKVVVREEDPSLVGSSLEKPIKRIEWHVTSLTDINIEDDPIFPPFIVNIVKKFEEFLNTNQFIQTQSIKYESVTSIPKSEFTAMMIRANRENQVMCVMVGNHLKTEMMNALKKFFNPFMIPLNVTSLYCKTYSPQNSTPNNSVTTFLLGQQYLIEHISNIKIELTPRSNYWTNAYGLEVLVKTINDFFIPVLENSTLLEIGCGIGLMSLLFTTKYVRVIGIDSSSEIDEAETNRQKNNNDKVLFLRENLNNNIQLFFEQLKKSDNVNAIINNNSPKIGRSTEIMASIRRLNSVKRLVFFGSFNKHTTNALLELMSPSDNVLGNLPFVPVKACIVDSIPDSDHFDIVMLMQRRAVRNQSSNDETTPVINLTEEPNILENVKEQQKILEEATQKLSSSNINPQVAEELKNLINTLRQKTNTLQTQFIPLINSAKTEDTPKKEEPKPPKPPQPPQAPPAAPVGLILEPGASKKYQRNLQPLEPNGRMGARRGRFMQYNNQPAERRPNIPIQSELAPIPVQQPIMVQIPYSEPYQSQPIQCEQNQSPCSWNSNSNSPPYNRPSIKRKLRPLSPVCPPAFDLKNRKKNSGDGFRSTSPPQENWDEEDPLPPHPPLVTRHREPSWDDQPSSSHNHHRRRHKYNRSYSPDYDRRSSRSPRRRYHSRSRSRSQSRSPSYCSRSRSRSRSYSRSRSRSRSPYSRRHRYSPTHSSRRHSPSRHRSSRSNKYRERTYSNSSSPGPVPPRDSPPGIPPPPKNSPPGLSPNCQQYMINRQLPIPMQMHIPMQMPVQMAMPMQMQMPVPITVPFTSATNEVDVKWAPQEIEFSPSRMPIRVSPKTTEHIVSNTNMELCNMSTDSPLSPNSNSPPVEHVRDPRLRGKLKTEEVSSSDDAQEMSLSGWVNGNGVALTPDMQQWQQQQQMMMGSNYAAWMRMPGNFTRPGVPQGPYMMQPYGWGYPSNSYPQGPPSSHGPHGPHGLHGPHGSHGPHGPHGPHMQPRSRGPPEQSGPPGSSGTPELHISPSGAHVRPMMSNAVPWQGSSNFAPNFAPPNISHFPNYIKDKK